MKKTLLLTAAALLPIFSHAAQLKASLSFNKSAPFVAVAYIAGNGANAKTLQVDQLNKKFDRAAYVLEPGQNIQFSNSDNMDHNIFINAPDANAEVDLGLLAPKQTAQAQTQDWKKPAVVRLACKIHPKMKAYVANVEAETSKIIELQRKVLNYEFSLSSEQAKPKFVLWMPKYDQVEVELVPGVQTVAITKRGKVKGELTLELI